ncbi:hypothetical protein [uncultured Clostridium sp.]|uniref:hypothetical protein n=1 Tax=uncultured Clostridium sp. TaxID=59620 RepID=UPI0026076FAB|nr:hypothetical protein [uncultured Clostridium sp.]
MSTQALQIINLRNISYPENSLTLFIKTFSKFKFDEIFSLRNEYPNATINIFTNEKKFVFLYTHSIKLLTSLNEKNINIIFSNNIQSDMLSIDNFFSFPLVYINKMIFLNTNNTTKENLKNISYSDPSTLKDLFIKSDNSYISNINTLTLSDINNLILDINYSDLELTSSDILQFSNFDNSTINLISILSEIDESLTYNEVGILLTNDSKKIGAYKKYGENQAKTGELLELVSISSSTPKTVTLTKLGKELLTVNKNIFDNIIFFEVLKCKFIKYLLSLCKFNERVNVKEICLPIVSEKTYLRRRSNIKHLITILRSKNIESLNMYLDKLSF